jgi:hypothetical protein
MRAAVTQGGLARDQIQDHKAARCVGSDLCSQTISDDYQRLRLGDYKRAVHYQVSAVGIVGEVTLWHVRSGLENSKTRISLELMPDR